MRLSFLTLLLAILTMIFVNLLVFLRVDFPAYPLMSVQDLLDLLTPLALIPVYWLLFRTESKTPARLGMEITFLVAATLWIAGHGLHLSANSIDNLIEGLEPVRRAAVEKSQVYELAYFYDEHLSHFIWHAGMVGLAALLIYQEWRDPAGQKTIVWATLLAGALFGVSWFTTFLEGQTVLLGFPFACAVALLAMFGGRQRLSGQPILAFYATSMLIASLLFAGWWLYWQGFPELTDVGWI